MDERALQGPPPAAAALVPAGAPPAAVGQRWPGLTDADVRALGEGELLVWDGVLGAERAAQLAAHFAGEEERLTPAAVGRGEERAFVPSVRGDRTRWLERALVAPELWLWELFDALALALCERAWLSVPALEVQLALYPGGGERYATHHDAFAGGGRRRATAAYYLNPGWEPAHGGELRARTPSGVRTLAPLADRLALWLSERVEHEVLPARAPRWAATAWFLGPG